MSFYWIRAFLNISFFSYFGKLTIISANLAMLFLLIYRGILENHFPLSNHAIKNLIIIDLFKNRIFKNMSENKIEFHFFFFREPNIFYSNFLKKSIMAYHQLIWMLFKRKI